MKDLVLFVVNGIFAVVIVFLIIGSICAAWWLSDKILTPYIGTNFAELVVISFLVFLLGGLSYISRKD